jgi:hypothetical protein
VAYSRTDPDPVIEAALCAFTESDSPEMQRAAVLSLAEARDPREDARASEVLAIRAIDRQEHDVVGLLEHIVRDDNVAESARVFAAVLCSITCRRQHRRVYGRQVISFVQALEETYPILIHMQALSYIDGNEADLRYGLFLAEKALALMPENPGTQHSLADFLVTVSYLDSDVSVETLGRAYDLVTRAIDETHWPRYFYTRARIERRLGEFKDAKNDLAEAIKLEDVNAPRRQDRIRDYLLESRLVDADRTTSGGIEQARTALSNAEQSVEDMRKSIDDRIGDIQTKAEERVGEMRKSIDDRIGDIQTKVVETIAFFAVVLALVEFSASTLRKGFGLGGSLLMIIVLGVTLFGAVVGGGWLLGWRSRPERDKK